MPGKKVAQKTAESRISAHKNAMGTGILLECFSAIDQNRRKQKAKQLDNLIELDCSHKKAHVDQNG